MLRVKGHNVLTPDLYEGEIFDDMEQANRRFQEIGIPEMMSRTMNSIRDFPEETVYAGFSNGGAAAEFLAGHDPAQRAACYFMQLCHSMLSESKNGRQVSMSRFIMQKLIHGRTSNLLNSFQKAFISPLVLNTSNIHAAGTCSLILIYRIMTGNLLNYYGKGS